MSQIAELRGRVKRLEERMDDVHELASGTDREVASWRTTLNNHNETLNAIREDQVDQGKKLARVEKDMHDGFARVDENFAKVDENFAKVDENFAKVDENFARVEKKFKLLHEGQDRITKLLTRHLGEPVDGTHSGGADE